MRVWRQAYQQFKTKRGARCSIENLLKRVLKGNPVGSISPAVDIYNAVSLTYALPLGGEDIDAFQGDLRLLITQGGDEFTPLGENAGNDPTLPGELCYVDDAGAVCRCWNWRDGVRTALTDATSNASLIVECVDPERIEDCRAATDELARLVEALPGRRDRRQGPCHPRKSRSGYRGIRERQAPGATHGTRDPNTTSATT